MQKPRVAHHFSALGTRKPRVVVIVGPTASGKSSLAVTLAKQWNGEVISADSRQVYRGMNIGTGKITKKEMRGVPHHLLSVVSPKKLYTVSDYVRDGERALRGILRRGKLPIVCGGTGFYVRGFVDKLELPNVPPDLLLRKRLEKKNAEELFAQLKKLDPAFALRIDRHNPRRLIRAIEIARSLGYVPPFKMQTPYDPLFIGIMLDSKKLARNIHRRLIARMKGGMLNEVRRLLRRGVSAVRMEEFGLEYRFCARYLRGIITKDEFVAQLERAIRQYARRQMTWFKKDNRVEWVGQDIKKTKRVVEKFLRRRRRVLTDGCAA